MPFDVGAIKSTLELDRSPFQAGLKLAQAQAEKFAGQTYTATLDVDTREMQRSLRDVQTALRGLRSGRSSAAVGVDDRQARDVLGRVRADLTAVQKTRARPEIDPRSIVHAVGRTRLLLDTLKMIGPAAIPAAAAASGAVLALGGALGSAGIAAGAFAIAAKGAFGDVFDAVEEVTKAQEQLERATTGGEVTAALEAQRGALDRLTAQQWVAAQSTLELREQFQGFGDDIEPQLFETFDDAIKGARASLESLRPILPDVAGVAAEAASDFRSFAESAEMDETIAFIRAQGIPALITFLEAAKDGAVGVGNLFAAFAPLNPGFLGSIREAAQNFRDFTGSLKGDPEFQAFLDYIRAAGPAVWETIKSIANAGIELVEAIAPLGGPALLIIRGLAEAVGLLAEHAPGVLQLAAALAIGKTAIGLLGEVSGHVTPVLAGMRDAITGTGAAGANAQTKLAAFTSFLGGPWGIAIGLGVTALTAFMTRNAEAEGRVRALTDAIVADSGALGDNARKRVVATLAETDMLEAARTAGLNVQEMTDAVLHGGSAYQAFAAKVDQAAAAHEAIIPWYNKTIMLEDDKSTALRNLASGLGGVREETAQATAAARLEATAMGQAVQPIDTVTGALNDQAKAARDARTAVLGLLDAHLQSRDDALAYRESHLAVREALARQTAVAKDAKATDLDRVRTNIAVEQSVLRAARAGQKKIDNMTAEQRNSPAYRAAIAKERDYMEGMADKSNEAARMVKIYDKELAKIDAKVHTDVSVTAEGKITVNGVPFAIASPEALAREANPTVGEQLLRPGRRAGGPIVGPGTGTSDSIPAYLSNGEHVLTAAEVRAAGGHGAIYAMRASLLGRRDEPPGEGARFATGGPAILPPFGISVRDAVMRSAEASRKALVEVFSATLKKAWSAAQAQAGGGGGPVAGGSVAKALEWARTQDGKAYQWGGGGNPSWDCSGFMAGIEQVMRGRQPGRLYTTMSFRGASAPAGWEQGLSAPFMVGVYNGASASNSHMAGTLNGVPVESSGSNGVQVGPPARGHNNSMFTHRYGFRPSVGDTEAGMARGGAVWGRGSGTSDDVPAWLSRGEHVWTAKEVRRAGGQNVMYALRKAFGGGARGEGMFYARGGKARRPGSEIQGGSGGGGSDSGSTGEDAAAEQPELTSPFEGFAEQLRGDAESIRTAIGEAIEQIREGLTGKRANSLVTVLQRAQTQLISITSRIETAQENLSRVTQMRETVTTGARELATVSGIGNVGSARDIIALAAQQRGQVAVFTRQLAALRRAGYARTIIEAAAGMGIEEGSEYARVLLSATTVQRRQINAAEAAGLRAATGIGAAAFTAAGGPQYQAAVTSLTTSLAKASEALEKRLVPATLGLASAGGELSDAAGSLKDAAGSMTDAARKASGGGQGSGGKKKTKKQALKKRTYDDGGDLPPGTTLAVNASGRTESTVTDAWRTRVEEALARLLTRQGSVNVTQEFRHPVDPYAAASATVSKIIREVM